MFYFMLDEKVFYAVLGAVTAIGIFSKCVVDVSLKRLVRAAENMGKSEHFLMRLVRAKFEHACMVSEKVENVGAFVDKYLYGYRVLGIRMHSLRRLEKAAAVLCVLLGAAEAAGAYLAAGMSDMVLQTGGMGLAMGVLVGVFHLVTDENYRMDMARNYMVDYLENVCLHRYEKAVKKEQEISAAAVRGQAGAFVRARGTEPLFPGSEPADPIPQTPPPNDAPGAEVPSPQTPPEILPPTMPEPYDTPEVQAAATVPKQKDTPPEKPVEKDVLIRQILEEYMA